MWTCCLVVTLKVFTDYVWPRLLRMGLRKLGIQISEQVSRKGRKRAVKKVRLSDLRQRSPEEGQEQDADNEREEEDEAKTTELSMATNCQPGGNVANHRDSVKLTFDHNFQVIFICRQLFKPFPCSSIQGKRSFFAESYANALA
uniref:Uncharacterized protein n=1 Tax=Ditylenchus dipsaci TaxID=166011 RepID=A0A915D8T6_9BILA